jgi:hypothetical protein
LYYDIIDLIKYGAYNSENGVEDDVKLEEYMKGYLSFNGMKRNQVKPYAKKILTRDIVDL